MARRKSKTGRRSESRWDFSVVFGVLRDQVVRRRLLRVFSISVVVSAACVAVCLGFDRLDGRVHRMARFDRGLTLRWENLPDWLRVGDNRRILEDLTQRVPLCRSDRLLDENLAERLGRALADPSVGWIKSVDRIFVRPSAVVSIQCQFRRPVAWVRAGLFCYLVDGEAVRLPGRYHAEECGGGPLLIIDGVAGNAPEVGQEWRGGDLAAGLKLAELLVNRPFRSQIAGVDVSNHDGRRDRNRPHIELTTDREGSRVWWGRPPGDEFGTEIHAAQKLALLETLYRQHGRIDMNRAYVNITTWPDRITMPAVPAGSTAARRQLRS